MCVYVAFTERDLQLLSHRHEVPELPKLRAAVAGGSSERSSLDAISRTASSMMSTTVDGAVTLGMSAGAVRTRALIRSAMNRWFSGRAAVRHLERRRGVGDGNIEPSRRKSQSRSPDTISPVARQQQRALLGRVPAPAGRLVVDRLVAGAPDQVLGAVVAECGGRGRVGQRDQIVMVDVPDRLRNRVRTASRKSSAATLSLYVTSASAMPR
jgi:hypothetical protein